MGYHLGLTCKAEDLKLTLKSSLKHITEEDQINLTIRSDNGPQMSSHQFKAYVDSMEMNHEFTPIRCPDKNAFVESFFSIFEIEFMQVRYFLSLKEVHRQVRDWVSWYNKKRLHGSLKYKSPEMFIENFKSGLSYEYKISA